MPDDRARHLLRLLLVSFPFLLPLVPAALLGSQGPVPPRSAGGETVEVKIKLVPFCAMDAEGKPIYDLRQDEIELRVGGRTVPIDTLDRPAAPETEPGGRERSDSRRPSRSSPSSRSVVFLLDSAFTSPSGFRNARLVAEKLLREVPADQRLWLWTHSAARGLEQKVGPVGGDPRGRARFLDALGRLTPEVDRLVTDPTGELALQAGSAGRGRGGAPGSQENSSIDSIRAFSRSEYEGIARELADSLDFLAAELRRLPGPKLLLVFWQGLDSQLFFEGDVSYGADSDARMISRRFSPLVTQFTAPLRAIADSGAMTVFINPGAPGGVGSDAEGPLRQMAQTAGAFYAAGADPQSVEQRVVAATSACYEAGFYVHGQAVAAREPVEVVIKRPGARDWAPATVKLRETWATLPAHEKKRLLLDLVAAGADAQRGSALLSLERLGGTVQSRPAGNGGRHLRYEAAWPDGLAGHELDVYNVTLALPARGEKVPRILRFDRHENARVGAGTAPIEVDLRKDDSLIWGIVAVEPATGCAWYRRLQLAGAASPGARRP
jgi:hypothetical protein